MKSLVIGFLIAVAFSPGAFARVKLVALPERTRVIVSLQNGEATLIEEERSITLQKGVNQVDFSWHAVSIDPTSIQVRMMSHPDKTLVLNTSYPPGETALIWEISSSAAQEERVRISYLLQGLSREIVYKAVAEPNESALALRDYVRLKNNSGEDLQNAEINLGYGPVFHKNIAHQETLEMQSERVDNLPLRKILTWDSAHLPWDPEYEKKTVGIPLSYLIRNDGPSHLGSHTLLPGKARIFIKGKSTDAGENVAFTGEDWAALTPVDRELKLYIGQSRDVKVTQRRVKSDRTNIRRNNHNLEVIWDVEESYRIEIENFKKTPAELTVIEHLPGYWKLSDPSHKIEKKDAFTVEFPLTLAAESTGAKKTVVTFNVSRLNVQNNEPTSY